MAFFAALACSTFSNVVALSDYDKRMAKVAKAKEIVEIGKRNDAAIVARAALHKAQFDKEIEALRLLKIQRNEEIYAGFGISVVAVTGGSCYLLCV